MRQTLPPYLSGLILRMDPPCCLGPTGHEEAFLSALPPGADTPTDTENPPKILKIHGLVMGDGEDMPTKF